MTATQAPNDILERLAGSDAATRRGAFTELAALGAEKAVALGAAALADPAKGGDAGARLALHGLSVHATRPGAEAERHAFFAAVARELDAPRPAPVRQFLVRLLQAAGRADAVPALARCLGDAAVAESARQALVATPGSEAVSALREALPKSAGPLRVGLLQALGLRRDAAAVELALAAAAQDDAALRVAAVEALGWIADPRGEEPILRALDKLESQPRRLAVESALRFAEARLGAGDRAAAARVHERLLRLETEKGARSAALLGLGRSGGVAQVAAVAAALEDADASLRHCALESLSVMPGDDVTRALGELAAKAKGDVKPGLERILARRGARA